MGGVVVKPVVGLVVETDDVLLSAEIARQYIVMKGLLSMNHDF